MIYLLALIPATMLTIAGYFVIYLSHRSEGNFRSFGKYLGFWAITLAGLVILGSLFAAAHHGRGGMLGLHGRMHGRMQGPRDIGGPWQGRPRFLRALPGDPREPQNDSVPAAGDAPTAPAAEPGSPPR
ncbi:MAG: hypothetical protein ABI616_03860 [Pseudomonadota bacterium]